MLSSSFVSVAFNFSHVPQKDHKGFMRIKCSLPFKMRGWGSDQPVCHAHTRKRRAPKPVLITIIPKHVILFFQEKVLQIFLGSSLYMINVWEGNMEKKLGCLPPQMLLIPCFALPFSWTSNMLTANQVSLTSYCQICFSFHSSCSWLLLILFFY